MSALNRGDSDLAATAARATRPYIGSVRDLQIEGLSPASGRLVAPSGSVRT